MKRSIRKFWLEPGLVIRGSEGEAEGAAPEGAPPAEGSGSENSDESGDGNAEGDEGGDAEKETFTKEEVENLRKTMRDERTERKRLAKELNTLKKGKQDEQTKTEADETAQRLKTAEDHAARLAESYRSARVEQAVFQAAQAANVLTPEDMVALLKSQGYPDIDVDQDEDDPSKVKVDSDDVKAAVKKALKSRAHWVKSAGSDSGPSGSQFRPNGSRSTEADSEALKSRFPALNRNR